MFDLYSTYGFPIELTLEIAREHGIEVDINEYEKLKASLKLMSKLAQGEQGGKIDNNYSDV